MPLFHNSVWQHPWSTAKQGSSPQSGSPEFLLGVELHRHGWLLPWLTAVSCHSRGQTVWSKVPTTSKVLAYLAWPQGEQISLWNRTSQGLRGYLSGSESKGQTSLWARLILCCTVQWRRPTEEEKKITCSTNANQFLTQTPQYYLTGLICKVAAVLHLRFIFLVLIFGLKIGGFFFFLRKYWLCTYYFLLREPPLPSTWECFGHRFSEKIVHQNTAIHHLYIPKGCHSVWNINIQCEINDSALALIF